MGLTEQSLLIKETLDICQPKNILLNIYLQTSLASVEDTLSYHFQLIPTHPDGKKNQQRNLHTVRECETNSMACHIMLSYSVLYTLCHHLSVAVNSDDKLYADLIGF